MSARTTHARTATALICLGATSVSVTRGLKDPIVIFQSMSANPPPVKTVGRAPIFTTPLCVSALLVTSASPANKTKMIAPMHHV